MPTNVQLLTRRSETSAQGLHLRLCGHYLAWASIESEFSYTRHVSLSVARSLKNASATQELNLEKTIRIFGT
jgi:hypothetical protein